MLAYKSSWKMINFEYHIICIKNKQVLIYNQINLPWTRSQCIFCMKIMSGISIYHKNTYRKLTWNLSLENILIILFNYFFDLSCYLQVCVTFFEKLYLFTEPTFAWPRIQYGYQTNVNESLQRPLFEPNTHKKNEWVFLLK